MNKILLTLLIILVGIASYAPPSYALPDKEAVQGTLKKADFFVKLGIIIVEGAQKVKRQITKYVNGVAGAIKDVKAFSEAVKTGDINGALSAADSLGGKVPGVDISGDVAAINNNISGATDLANSATGSVAGVANKMNELKNTSPSSLLNINDTKQTKKDLSKTYYGQYGTDSDINVFENQREKIEGIQRDNIANMYAKALTRRVAIAKEKAETPEEIDSTNTRALVSATNDVAMKTAGRLRKIMEFEAAIYDYRLTQATKQYVVVDEKAKSNAAKEKAENTQEEQP